MGKERLTAFSDAVLAIVMTILVLELNLPSAPTLGALWELRISFFSYALSSFWLGTMWTNLHNEWHAVEHVSKSVIWWNLILLFFSSLIPYATSFVNLHFYNTTAQIFYGTVVLSVNREHHWPELLSGTGQRGGYSAAGHDRRRTVQPDNRYHRQGAGHGRRNLVSTDGDDQRAAHHAVYAVSGIPPRG